MEGVHVVGPGQGVGVPQWGPGAKGPVRGLGTK